MAACSNNSVTMTITPITRRPHCLLVNNHQTQKKRRLNRETERKEYRRTDGGQSSTDGHTQRHMNRKTEGEKVTKRERQLLQTPCFVKVKIEALGDVALCCK